MEKINTDPFITLYKNQVLINYLFRVGNRKKLWLKDAKFIGFNGSCTLLPEYNYHHIF